MLEMLHKVEKDLPNFLNLKDGWNTVYIDYHKPFVERVWRQYGKYRINLHCIYPCLPEESLFHSHPWDSAMRLFGTYEMKLGFHYDFSQGNNKFIPHDFILAKLILNSGDEYEMTDPCGWHAVCPIDKPAMSLMVTGEPRGNMPSKKLNLQPLSDERKFEIINFFKSIYKGM